MDDHLFGSCNITFNFFVVSDRISSFDNWIIFAGGVLCGIGGVSQFKIYSPRRVKKYPKHPL
jgi:hypothetical protein